MNLMLMKEIATSMVNTNTITMPIDLVEEYIHRVKWMIQYIIHPSMFKMINP
jgi:hypothetical protein